MQYYFEPLEIPGKLVLDKFRGQFEYLFFFLEPSKPLASFYNYSEPYLKYLEKEFSLKPELLSHEKGKVNYWYFEDQKPIFDKIEIFRMLNELNLWDHEIYVANSKNDLRQGGYLLKSPFGFSGRGIREFNTSFEYQYPILVERKLNRIKDFSFFKDKSFKFYQNFIGDQYNYTGSYFCQNEVMDFKAWFLRNDVKYPEIEKFEKRLLKLDQVLFENGFSKYNIDCFLYQEDSDVKIHFACDVNLRKTMGYLLYKIYEMYFSTEPFIRFELSKSPPNRQKGCLGPTENLPFYITYNFDFVSL